MKHIEIETILTFCSYKEYGSQEFYDINLGYDGKYTSAKKLLDRSGFFDTIVQICEECERSPTELIKISTAADWTKKGFTFDIENGKWSFGSWRGQNTDWSDNLAKVYGFGIDDDTAEQELKVIALFEIIFAKEKAAAIQSAMSK